MGISPTENRRLCTTHTFLPYALVSWLCFWYSIEDDDLQWIEFKGVPLASRQSKRLACCVLILGALEHIVVYRMLRQCERLADVEREPSRLVRWVAQRSLQQTEVRL